SNPVAVIEIEVFGAALIEVLTGVAGGEHFFHRIDDLAAVPRKHLGFGLIIRRYLFFKLVQAVFRKDRWRHLLDHQQLLVSGRIQRLNDIESRSERVFLRITPVERRYLKVLAFRSPPGLLEEHRLDYIRIEFLIRLK